MVSLPNGVPCMNEWLVFSMYNVCRMVTEEGDFLPVTVLVNTQCPGIVFNSTSYYSQSAPFWIITI